MTQIIIQDDFYTDEMCKQNPQNLYVFGDNVVRFGKAGQAIIRDNENAFGIATKMFPSNSIESFFMDTDEVFSYVENDVLKLYGIYKTNKYQNIVFPKAGLGTGLARMYEWSPKIFEWLCYELKTAYNINMTKKGFE